MARSESADVVLMDIRMPVIDSLEATRRIAAVDELAGVKVIIITTFEIVFFFQAEDGIRAFHETGVQTCALPICCSSVPWLSTMRAAMVWLLITPASDMKPR